jgi:hypothetical protein
VSGGVVRVALATLWRHPRPGGAADIVTQLLLGEPVVVDEVRAGWARVVATTQPAPARDPRGYPGWLPAGQLAEASTVDGEPMSVVDVLVTQLRDAPGGAVAVPAVALGTRLAAAGPPVGGWRPVRTPGRPEPLWVPEGDLRTLPLPGGPPSGAQALAVARRLIGPSMKDRALSKFFFHSVAVCGHQPSHITVPVPISWRFDGPERRQPLNVMISSLRRRPRA